MMMNEVSEVKARRNDMDFFFLEQLE